MSASLPALHTADPPVITSARRCARAPAGFADFLIQLANPSRTR
ncbi:MAG: hypothetical protein QOG46_1339 [Pseudonocardiales bacterium]|nr:hypothetical protein [Pseudonocardiales bacterium]